MRRCSRTWRGVFVLAVSFLVVGCGPSPGPRLRFFASGEPGITVVSYNVQNLFDGISQGTEYRDFDPARSDYDESQYRRRLGELAESLARSLPEPPTLLALQEIENRQVLVDFLEAAGWSYAYEEVIFDPARIGSVGVGLASTKPVARIRGHRPVFHGRPGRTILEVHLREPGYADSVAGGSAAGGSAPENSDGEARSRIVVFVNHWKSQRPTPEETEPQRRLAGRIVARRLADTPGSLSLVVGDLNTERPALSTVRQPWERSGVPGSYAYRGRWQRLDHILYASDGSYELVEFRIIRSPDALTGEGFPKRWMPGRGGLSDHLPLFARFVRTRERSVHAQSAPVE